MLVSTMFAEWKESVRRGYRLHITNLENKTYTYTIRYWVTPPDNSTDWTSALNFFFSVLYFALYGSRAKVVAPSFQSSGNVYVAAMTFAIEAGQTVSVGTTPPVTGLLPANFAMSFLEGYVTLEVPVLRGGPNHLTFMPAPQASGPLKVLLNPETTMVHVDTTTHVGWITNADGIVTGKIPVVPLNFDTVEPLIVATGKAENEITPNGLFKLGRDALTAAVKGAATLESASTTATDELTAPDRMSALVGLLCELDTQEEFLSDLNKVLAQNKAPARICLQGAAKR